MCGRFTLTPSFAQVADRFGALGPAFDLPPHYNIAPTQQVPVVVTTEGRHLKKMRWGLIPHWAKEMSIGNRMINARAETLLTKPSFRSLIRHRRCLVPASGFYEWHQETGRRGKTPYYIHGKDDNLFAFAGLWDRWEDPSEGTIESFTIITTEANPLIAKIHDRMPVILSEEEETIWLDDTVSEPSKLLPLLDPYPANLMETYPVSSLVNSPKNDTPVCMQKI